MPASRHDLGHRVLPPYSGSLDLIPYYRITEARRRHSQFVLRISLLILAQFVTIAYLVLRLTEKGCF